MTSKGLVLKKGDWVVHAQHGLGQVTDSSTKVIADRKVVCLEIKTASLSYWLPIDDGTPHPIRNLANQKDMQTALQHIAAKPIPLSDDYRIRNSYIQSEISLGTLQASAGLIRDLSARHPLKGNDVNENSALARLKHHFVDELMHACDLTRPAAEKKLEGALQRSAETLSPH